jgi:hypothetical protein
MASTALQPPDDPPDDPIDESVARRSGRSTWLPGPRWRAGALSLLMLGLVMSPIVENWREEPIDSFPLSYYPMFTEKRGETTRVSYLAGFDQQGHRHVIPYFLIGTGGLNQVRRQIPRLIDKRQANELCREVSSRIAKRQGEPFSSMIALRVMTGTYRLADRYVGEKAPISEYVHARCDVKRAA